jgi:hypothetical protein
VPTSDLDGSNFAAYGATGNYLGPGAQHLASDLAQRSTACKLTTGVVTILPIVIRGRLALPCGGAKSHQHRLVPTNSDRCFRTHLRTTILRPDLETIIRNITGTQVSKRTGAAGCAPWKVDGRDRSLTIPARSTY